MGLLIFVYLLLCLDIYALGDDSFISLGSFMQTKHLYLDPHHN